MRQTVLLGPHIDIHPGFHGSLRLDPPDGISFHQRGARHHFLISKGNRGASPQTVFEQPHFGEFVDFGPGPQVAHSVRWPVVGRRAWVADMDDFGYPLLLGRYAIQAGLEATDGNPWSDALITVTRRRLALMLAAYAHPSCKAILFWTRHAQDNAERLLNRFGLDDDGKRYLEKSRVVYPAQRPTALPTAVAAKWSDTDRMKIVFVGNDYAAKNGRMALEIFQRLRRRHPDVELTYVGQVPVEDLTLTEGIRHLTDLPRAEVLNLFRASHILFHPARSESFGMVLLEAAASGLAIVAARGDGLAHLDELFADHQACLLDRNAVQADEEATAFEDRLNELVSQPSSARAFGMASYEVTTRGHLSLQARNRTLADLYRRAAIDTGNDPLSLATLGGDDLEVEHFDSDSVRDAQREFRRQRGITQLNFYVPADAFHPAGGEPANEIHPSPPFAGRRGPSNQSARS